MPQYDYVNGPNPDAGLDLPKVQSSAPGANQPSVLPSPQPPEPDYMRVGRAASSPKGDPTIGAYPNTPEGTTGGAVTPQVAQMQPFNYDLNSVNPTSDLEYNSFLRGMGFTQQQAQQQAAYQRANIESQLQLELPWQQQQEQRGLENSAFNANDRGVANSSSAVQGYTDVRNAANYQQAQTRNSAQQQNDSLNFNLQNTLAGLQNQQAEQDLAARQRILQAQNQQAAYANALQMFGINGGNGQ